MTSGLIAHKAGMSQYFDEKGKRIPVTLLKIHDNYVIGLKDGKVVLGALENKNIKNPQKKYFEKNQLPNLKHIKEFKAEGQFDIGHKFTAEAFKDIEFVDVTSRTKGRGFTGCIKRWNFGSLRATHGVSLGERKPGSTGNRQDPGRVFKGKKMSGHYGDEQVTIQNLKIVEIMPEENIILLKGAVPGPKGALVYLKKAIKKQHNNKGE